MENLSRYIIRASFSQERMTYVSEEAKVVYKSKDRRQEKIFHALEWIAAMCSHVPDKGEQMVRYYGFYSNVSRGKRKIQDQDDQYNVIVMMTVVMDSDVKTKNKNVCQMINRTIPREDQTIQMYTKHK